MISRYLGHAFHASAGSHFTLSGRLAAFALLPPLLHETHFCLVHRLIHKPFLYKWMHSVHHNSFNPNPWSSLSMHPVEHLLYWSGALIRLVVPSHPLLVLYHIQISGTGAVVGHIGFDKIEMGDSSAMDTHAYAHYLHHKYFEVNYTDGGCAQRCATGP